MFLTTIISFVLLLVTSSMGAENWVLHVPAGQETASKVAKLHYLDNLGEVIPGMS